MGCMRIPEGDLSFVNIDLTPTTSVLSRRHCDDECSMAPVSVPVASTPFDRHFWYYLLPGLSVTMREQTRDWSFAVKAHLYRVDSRH
jgi:hypothetical protein